MLPTSDHCRTALGALAAVSALGLAGCSAGSAGPADATAPLTGAGNTVSGAPSADATADDSGEPAAASAGGAATGDGAEDGPTADPTARAQGPEPRDGAAARGDLCATSQLKLAVEPAGAATGSVFLALTAANTSEAPCTIAGYPGVSFVDARGTMIGVPAVRAPAAPGTAQVLAPGESATAMLRTARAAMYPACDPRPAAGLRVYPPESTEPVVVPHPVQACTNPAVQQLEIQGFGT